jgi:2-oxoisovalerate dehydrogenase E1 component beta subunit
MAQMNMIEAIRSALDVTMGNDPNVVVMGEDVGYFGGVFRCTDGLQRKYGEHRVIDAPIAEGGIIGAAIGMGVNGLRPVAEIQFADYIYPGFDQIVSELARLRYRSCGDAVWRWHSRRTNAFAKSRGNFCARQWHSDRNALEPL